MAESVISERQDHTCRALRYVDVVKIGTKQSKALLSFTRVSPFSLRDSATIVVGTAITASPDGRTPP